MKAIENIKQAIQNGDNESALIECGKAEDFIYSLIALGLMMIGLFLALALFFAIMGVMV